jgi:DnaJ-domain-containing protein 1
MEAIDTLIKEFDTINLKAMLLVMVIYGIIPFLISRLAKSFIPRLVFFGIGVYGFVGCIDTSTAILLDLDFYIILGLIAPHILYMSKVAISLLIDLKNATVNYYYFMLTIYYKIINFFRAFKAFIKKMINVIKGKEKFFNGKSKNSYRYQRQKNRYEKERAKYHNEEYQEDSYNYSKEQEFYDRYSNFFNEDETQNNNYHSNQSSNQNSNYQQQNQYNGYRDEYHSNIVPELKQFYSLDPFTVLGLSINDDCSTIKKQYRTLAKKYHPDKNGDKYTEIMKFINSANDDIKALKGC